MAGQSWSDLNDFLASQITSLGPSASYGPMGEYDSYNSLLDYWMSTGKQAASPSDPEYKKWAGARVLGDKTPEQYIASLNEKIGLGPNNLTGNDQGGYAWDAANNRVMSRNYDSGNDFLDWIQVPLMFGGMALGAGALTGALGGAAGAGALEGAGAFGGEAFGAAANTAGAYGGSVAPWITSGAGAVGATGAGVENFDWIDELLKESGEFGVDPASLEGGFNSALSTAPWWSSLPQGGQSLVQGLSKLFGGNSGGTSGTGNGSYQFPFGDVLGGLLESYGASQKSDDLRSYLDKALTYADPFHDQRPGYQTQFKQLTQDPNNFFQDPAISRTIGLQQDATSRRLASQGYNMSGNFATDVAQSGMDAAFKNYLPYSDMIGTAAGYKLTPGASGELTANMGSAIAGQNQQVMGGLGAATQSAMTGQQPSYLDSLFGQKQNQNLMQLFMQGLS